MHVAAARDVFADAVRIDDATFCQNGAFLARVEGDSLLTEESLVGSGIEVEEAIDGFVVDERFVDDRFGIVGGDFAVENAIGFDGDEGTLLAKALASRARHIDASNVCRFGQRFAHFDDDIEIGAFCVFDNGIANFQTTVGNATSTGTNDDASLNFCFESTV